MIKLRKHTLALCVLLLVTAIYFISGAEPNSMQSMMCMCKAPSSIPVEELFIHLPGGFFSVYEAKQGAVYSPDINILPKAVGNAFLYREQHECLGQLVMVLDAIRYDSPYVYTIDGLVKVFVNGTEQILSMDRIDYVCDSEHNNLCYRLTCTPRSGCDSNIGHVYMICCSCGQDQSVLVGSISYISQDGGLKASYLFFITGRNELDAERHLLKKIAKATSY